MDEFEPTEITEAQIAESNEAIGRMLETSAWREFLLHSVCEMHRLDRLAMRYDISESLRIFCNGQRAALMEITRWPYDLTGRPYPCDEELMAFYGRLGADPRMLRTPQPRVIPKAAEPPRRTRGRGAGVIA